ncbi:MAG TPA: GAF domain-containing protein, partial [Pseudorhizobium sp.]|nr:GAF domain-containing protein [Pseudorhizobium sp.]
MDRSEPDLDACAREPIHIPGAIQPHGALIVLRPRDMRVLQASGNSSEFFGENLAATGVVTGPLSKILSRLKDWYETQEPTFQVLIAGGTLLVTAHRSAWSIVVEVERADKAQVDTLLTRLKGFAQTLAAKDDVPGSLEAATHFILELTAFDRVLVYQFDEGWNGHVIAETGNGKLPSYLDLRFPAGDIPAQARALYTTNRLRIIPDAGYRPVPIMPVINPDTSEPIDLSQAQLRSVSPVHLEYMRNMATAASMSVSIMIGDKLWGLISCHSAEPHRVPPTIRDACDFVAQSLSMKIAAQVRSEDAASRVALAQVSARLLSNMSEEASWLEGLARKPRDLLEQVRASGAAIVTEDAFQAVGVTPPET